MCKFEIATFPTEEVTRGVYTVEIITGRHMNHTWMLYGSHVIESIITDTDNTGKKGDRREPFAARKSTLTDCGHLGRNDDRRKALTT